MRNYKLIVWLMILAFPLTAASQEISYRSNILLINKEANSGDDIFPKIIWKSYNSLSNFIDPGLVNVSAIIESKIPLHEIKISVFDNDRLIATKDFPIDSEEELNRVISNNVYLTKGIKSIKVIAKTKTGVVSNEEKHFIVGDEAIAEAVVKNRIDRAILIATDEYTEWENLVNPVFDANTIAEELRTNYGFDVELLLNPTAEEILLKLKDYSKIEYSPQDQLFIFFAGHGQFEPTFGEGFVVTKNSKRDDPTFTTYISHSRLSTIINNMPCEHIFVTMDVCYGGAFSEAVSTSRGDVAIYSEIENEELIRRKLKYKSRMYLTSGGMVYVSDGLPGKHSPFGRKFITALRNYGGSDGILTLLELRLFIDRLEPSPKFGEFGDNVPGGDFIFVFK